jgi:hypothetical protein
MKPHYEKPLATLSGEQFAHQLDGLLRRAPSLATALNVCSDALVDVAFARAGEQGATEIERAATEIERAAQRMRQRIKA